MTLRAAPPFRADHVGSFLRPKCLLDAREQLAKRRDRRRRAARGRGQARSRDIVQVPGGPRPARRSPTASSAAPTSTSTSSSSSTASRPRAASPCSFHSAARQRRLRAAGDARDAARCATRRPSSVADFEFLKSADQAHAEGDDSVADDAAFPRRPRGDQHARRYPDLEAFYDDVAAAYARRARRARAPPAARYVQLDDTNLAYLCDEKMREARARARRRSRTSCRTATRSSSTRAIAQTPGRHDASACTCAAATSRAPGRREGGYEPVAEVLFNELDVDGYFLEYDDARSGDFAPLRHVPKGKTVVLGLVTTKLDRMESKDDLKRRIDEAAKFVPLEQLCAVAAMRLLEHGPRQRDPRRGAGAKLRLVRRDRARSLGRRLMDRRKAFDDDDGTTLAIGLVGYGEVGKILARGARSRAASAWVGTWDLLLRDPACGTGDARARGRRRRRGDAVARGAAGARRRRDFGGHGVADARRRHRGRAHDPARHLVRRSQFGVAGHEGAQRRARRRRGRPLCRMPRS